MADTKRSKSDLATLLADNTSGAISPQDVRDFLESMDLSFASMYFSSSAETTIAVAGTYVLAAGTTTSIKLSNFTMPQDNRLTYTGAADVYAEISASISMTCASNSKIVGMKIAKNGTVIDSTEIHRKISTGADIGAAYVQGDVQLATNDYIELFISNETDTANATIDFCNLRVKGAFI